MSIPKFIYGGTSGASSPEELQRLREIAASLAAPRAPKNVGEGLSAIGDALGYRIMESKADRMSQAGNDSAQSAIAKALGGMGSFPDTPAAGGGGTSAGAADYGGDQLAWQDAKPYQKALLNTISGPESGGRYNVIYGGGKFDDFSRHPNKAVRIQTGPNAGRTSSAAGKYQFLGSTWDQQAKELGLPDFSPVNQDKAAWNLAAETYKAKTGQEIDTVLQSGDPEAIANVGKVLSPIWTSLPGGIEQGTNTNRFVATYQKALGQGASPAQAKQVAQAEAQKPVQVASTDPSAGVAQALAGGASPYAGTTKAQWAAMNRPGEDLAPSPVSPVAAALQQPPQPGVDPGAPAAVTPAGQRVVQQMTNPQSMTGGAPLPMMGMPPQQQAQTAPPVPQQVAPQPNLDQIPVEAGGNGGAIQRNQLPSVQQLMEASQNPWLNEQQRGVVNMLLKQQMDQADPNNALDAEYKRAQIDALKAKPDQTPESVRALDLRAQQAGLVQGSKEYRDFMLSGGAPKAETKPAGIQEYEYAKGQGFPGTYADWEASKKGGMSLQVDPTTGEVTFQQGGNIKPMTEAQSKDTTFATRAEGALPLVDKFGDALTNLGESAGGQVPVIGNYMKSKEYQQAEQAGKEFLQAILRKDTGAAITAGETAEYGTVYLPRPGDSPELLAQKKASRARALEALKAGMTPQALLAQEKAIAASGGAAPAPEAPKKRLKFNPATGELE